MLQKHAQTNTDTDQTQNKSRPDQAKLFTLDISTGKIQYGEPKINFNLEKYLIEEPF